MLLIRAANANVRCSIVRIPNSINLRLLKRCFSCLFVNPADPSCLALKGLCQRTLACWDGGLETRLTVYFECCQVEISASVCSLVQTCTTDCSVSECDHEASTMNRLWLKKDCRVMMEVEEFLNT
jgi:hypothetical protein